MVAVREHKQSVNGSFFVLEALHDMAQPVDVLRSLCRALTPGGSVIVADEKVGEHFHAP